MEEVPGFHLSYNFEDVAWSFERTTRWCVQHQKFKKAIQTKQLLTIWDICLATGINCKDGVHELNEKICEEDFLTGRCSCQTHEEISVKYDKMGVKLLEISDKLDSLTKLEIANSSDGFAPVKNKKQAKKTDPKLELVGQIYQLKSQMDALLISRQIHYSELGMIPLNTQYKRWLEEKEAKAKIEAEIKSKSPVKESWDHGLDDNAKITKPVVKIVKFGGKK
jgi:hypothetical protein